MAQYELSKDQLRTLMHRDVELMLNFYIGEELDLEVPEIHSELWDELVDLLDQVSDPSFVVGKLQKLIAIPREHAKTTLIKLAVILFVRYSKLSFCAYVSNTFGVALNGVRDIKDWFTSEQDMELFGPPVVRKSSENEGLFIVDICTPSSDKRKSVILKAFGQGTQIRGTLINGQRPDILIFDDVESNETASSEVQQAKLDAWCTGTAMKAMARRGVCIFIGNMVGDKCLLARLAKDPKWNATVLGAIVRNRQSELVALWPERWSLETLLADYADYRRLGQGHVWEAELMNLTSKDILGESLENALRPPKPVPDELEAGFICLDPAFGLNSWHDDSSITVHVRLRHGDIPIVVDSSTGKYDTDRLFDEMLRLSMYWGIRTWVIEAQAAQRLLISYFRALCIQRKISENMILFLPIQAGKNSKASRIVAFRSAVANGSYAVVEEEQDLIDKLESYTPSSKEHDDLCDSAAYGIQVWSLYGKAIEAAGIINIAGNLFGRRGENQNLSAVQMGIP